MPLPVKRKLFQTYPSPHDRNSFAHLKAWFLTYGRGVECAGVRSRQMFDLKEEHSLRVAMEIEVLARELHWSAADVALSKVMGLLHDIGRFEQYARYRTWDDRASADHGRLGIETIRNSKILKNFSRNDQDLIEKAILYHNRASLPKRETERCLAFAGLLRDADKLDIYRVVSEIYAGRKESEFASLPEGDDISDRVIGDICERTIVRIGHVQNQIDLKFLRLGWIFDINYVATLKKLVQRGYCETIRLPLPKTEKINTALATLDTYLTNRLQDVSSEEL